MTKKTADPARNNAIAGFLLEAVIGAPEEQNMKKLEALWKLTVGQLEPAKRDEVIEQRWLRYVLANQDFTKANWLLNKYQGNKTALVAKTMARISGFGDPQMVLTTIDGITKAGVNHQWLEALQEPITRGDYRAIDTFFIKQQLEQEIGQPTGKADSQGRPHL